MLYQFLDAIKCMMHPNFRNLKMWKKYILKLKKYIDLRFFWDVKQISYRWKIYIPLFQFTME